MKRTTTRRRREMKQFLSDNRRLFPFVALFIGGVAIGVTVYITARPPESLMQSLAEPMPAPTNLGEWLSALWGCCFSPLLLLGGLYLLGLWACGAPFILAVPLFHGLGLGLSEAYYYASGLTGVVTVVTCVMPIGLLTAAVLTMAGAESLRLSLCLSRQLLPSGERDEVNNSFRLYNLRYLLFAGATLLIGLLDVLLHYRK